MCLSYNTVYKCKLYNFDKIDTKYFNNKIQRMMVGQQKENMVMIQILLIYKLQQDEMKERITVYQQENKTKITTFKVF